MSIVSWIQLSDWHQGLQVQERDEVRDGLLDDIAARAEIDDRLAAVDMLLISGDIAFSGKAAEYVAARDELLLPIVETTSLAREQIVIVPGNHDVDQDIVGLYKTEWITDLHDEAAVSAMLNDPPLRSALLQPFAAYESFARRLSGVEKDISPAYGYSRICTSHAATVQVLALNSALISARFTSSTGKVVDQGNLVIGQPQLTPLLSRTPEVDLRIGLLHHPTSWLAEFEMHRVQRQLVSVCDLVLHGHEHVPNVQVVSEAAGEAIFVRAGAAYHSDSSAWSYGYNYVVVDVDAGEGAVYLRRWSPVKRRWGADVETTDDGCFPFRLEVRASSSHSIPAKSAKLAEHTKRAIANYRRRLTMEYQYADHRGIAGVTGAPFAATLPADDIYVEPCVVPADHPIERDRERALLDLIEDPDLSSSERRRYEIEYAAVTGQQWAPRGPEEPTSTVGAALGAARHLVLLGSPGVGKSALTRFLARTCLAGPVEMESRLGWHEELLPIVIPLASYSEARTQVPALTLDAYITDRLKEKHGDDLAAAVALLMQNNQCLLLLDGVDEVPDRRDRGALVRAVDEFLVNHPTLRTVITSRPYGYIRLAGALPHFRLPNFTSQQVADFVRKYYRATEKAKHNVESDLDKADAEAEALLGEIQQNQRVAELATNPLMLVIIALIRYERAHLIEERVQLYHRAVMTLVDTWAQWRSAPTLEARRESIPSDRILRVWAEVAHWMHLEKPVGVVHRSEIERQLAKVIAEHEFDDDGSADDLAYRYFEVVAGSGLLEERASGLFAFWHPTFEEFLAAVHLATPSAQATRRVVEVRSNPRWREVVLLCIGYVGVIQLDGDQATDMIHGVAVAELPPDEIFTKECLALAGQAVREYPSLKRATADSLIVDLIEAVRAYGHTWLIDGLATASRALPRLKPSSDLVKLMSETAQYDSWSVRMEIARLAGGGAVQADKACIDICHALVLDRDVDVRCYAAFGLMQSGSQSVDVWNIALRGYGGMFAKMETPLVRFLSKLDVEQLREVFMHDGIDVEALAGLCRKSGDMTQEVGDLIRAHAARGAEDTFPWAETRDGEDPDGSVIGAVAALRVDDREAAIVGLLQRGEFGERAVRSALAFVLDQSIDMRRRLHVMVQLPSTGYRQGEAEQLLEAAIVAEFNGESATTMVTREIATLGGELRECVYACAAADERPAAMLVASFLAPDDSTAKQYAKAAAECLSTDTPAFVAAIRRVDADTLGQGSLVERMRAIVGDQSAPSHTRIAVARPLYGAAKNSHAVIIASLTEMARGGSGAALREMIELGLPQDIVIPLISDERTLDRLWEAVGYFEAGSVCDYLIDAGCVEAALYVLEKLFDMGLGVERWRIEETVGSAGRLIGDSRRRKRAMAWADGKHAREVIVGMLYYEAGSARVARQGVGILGEALTPPWRDAVKCFSVFSRRSATRRERVAAWKSVAGALSSRSDETDPVSETARVLLRSWFLDHRGVEGRDPQ